MINFPSIRSTKAWILISYLSKNMKWKVGNMYKISSGNIKHFLKPRNQEPKTRKPFFYFQVRESPSTFWFPPLHPTTFSGDTMNSVERRSSELGRNEFLICIVFSGGFGVYIIPKWLIKVPGPFPILFKWFRELRKFG